MSNFVQVITVQDINPPVLTGVPGNTTVECDAIPAPPAVTATDDCSPNPAVTMAQSITPGSCINNYGITRTWTATDLCNNTATATQTITVQDNTDPIIITCALPQSSPANALCLAAVPNYTAFVTATDNCSAAGSLNITQSPAAGTQVGIGITIITITVTDGCNNQATCTTTFTVTPEPTPVIISQPSDQIICLGDNASFSIIATGTGPITYRWQVNTGSGWNNLSNGGVYSGVGNSTINLNSPPFSMNGYQYRCIVSTCSQQVISQPATLTISPDIISGVISSDQTICYNTIPAALNATPPTGGSGIFILQWQESVDNITFTDITGETTLSYSPGALVQTTYYRLRQTASTGCGFAYTNVITITGLPIFIPGIATADQTICYNSSPISIHTSNPSGGDGIYTYQWQESTDNILFVNIPGATNHTYSPGNLTQTTYYRQIQTSGNGCGSVITNVVTITVLPELIAGIATADQVICANSIPMTLNASAPTGGDGFYTYRWQISTDNITFNNIPGATSLSYSPGPLSQTTYYRLRQSSGSRCGNVTTNVVTIVVNQILIAGIATADQTICYNTLPATLNTSSPTGGDGTYTYQWQVSTNNVLFIDIPGATALSYSPGALTQTTYYRQVQTSGNSCGTDNTNVVTITVLQILIAGIATANQTICFNTSPSSIQTNNPSGGDGNYTYQWQVSTDNILFVNIPGATNHIYSPGNLTQTTFYRQVQTSGNVCGSVITNVVTITVYPDIIAGLATANQIICHNTIPSTLNASAPSGGDGTYTYQWQVSTDSILFNNIPGANTLSYSPGALSQTNYYRLIQRSGNGCGAVFTNVIRISVNPSFVVGLASANQIICYNTIPAMLKATPPTGGDGTYSFQWQISTDNIQFTDITGATFLSFSPGILSHTTFYRLSQSSGSGCGIGNTNVVKIIVYDLFIAGIASADQTICYNSSPSAINAGIPSGGDGIYSYQWQVSTDNILYSDIPGANAFSYSPGILTQTTYFRQVQTSGNSCGSSNTNTVTITVLPQLNAGIATADQIICTNSIPSALNASAPTGGNGSYTYQWQESTDNILFSNIPGATSLSYSPGIINQTTYYRLMQTSGGSCGTVTTNTVIISFNLNPFVSDLTTSVCSDFPSNINFSAGTSVPADSYSIININSNGLVASAGNPSNGNGFAANVIADDAWTNPTGTQTDVIYTVIPVSSVGCPGNPFLATIHVQGEPIVSSQSLTICSDNVTGIILGPSTTVPVASYNIITINSNGMIASSGNPSTGAGFSANVIADDAWTNTGNSSVNVIYTIVPESADGCFGNPFTITITVAPEPVVNDLTSEIACSGNSTGMILSPGSNVPATSYNIISINSNGLTASAGNPSTGTGFPNDVLSDDAWINTTSNPVDVIYTVVAVSSQGCTGDSFTVTIQVQPRLIIDFTTNTACWGDTTFFTLIGTNINSISLWNWDFGDGTFWSCNSPGCGSEPHVFPFNGTYPVTLHVTDTNGCEYEVTHPVIVIQRPVAFFSYDTPDCLGSSIQFIDLSTSPTDPVFTYIKQWVWDFGDGTPPHTITFPADPNISYSYAGIGNYHVTLTITNSQGCSDSFTANITVTNRPIANFSWAGSCEDAITLFQDFSDENGGGEIISWLWDFGDPTSGINNNSELQNPSHIYATSGNFIVTLITVNFNGCSDTIQHVFIVKAAPDAKFTSTPGCIGTPTEFTANLFLPDAGIIATCLWDFGDGNTANTPVALNNYSSPGSYIVFLTITDTAGCEGFYSDTINVSQPPFAHFSVNTSNCISESISFSNLSTTEAGHITGWNWDFGDGSNQSIFFPDNPDVNHNYALTGSYLVTLLVITSEGCTDSEQILVTVTPGPIAAFAYQKGCISEPVNFTDNSAVIGNTAITGWSWDFGDPASGVNNSSILQNPSHTFVNAGTYNVQLIISTANSCSSTIVRSLIVRPLPPTDFLVQGACLGNPVLFMPDDDVMNMNTITSWFWQFGDGVTSTSLNPTHVYTIAGIYNVTLSTTDTAGCSNSISREVHINPLPLVNFDFTAPACQESIVQFEDLSTVQSGYIVRWIWDFGDGTAQTINFPDIPNVNHGYANAGSYNVTLTVKTNDSCSNQVVKTVSILAKPTALFSHSSGCEDIAVSFSDLSEGIAGYGISQRIWNFGDPASGMSNTSVVQNPIHIYNTTGTYTTELIVFTINGCSDTLSQDVIVSATPIVNFTSAPACNGSTTNFISSASVNSTTQSWIWQFGDGTTSSLADPGHVYVQSGTYSVTLTINDSSGCTNTITHPVIIPPKPYANFSSSSPGCLGFPITFNDLTNPNGGIISGWHMDFGDGTDTTLATLPINMIHTYSGFGSFIVTLTVQTPEGCSDMIQRTIIISPSPIAAFLYANTCESEAVQFTDQSALNGGTGIVGWQWNFGDPASGTSNISLLENPAHIYSSSGSFTITHIVINSAGCIDSVQSQINILAKPTVGFIIDSITCLGTSTTFLINEAITNVAAIQTFDWNFGDGTSHSPQQNPTHTYLSAGTYTVTLTVTDTIGCGNATSREISIHSMPTAAFSYSSSCEGGQTNFTDQSIAPNGEIITAWTWDFGDETAVVPTSTIQNPIHTYAYSGSYNVTQTISTENGCTNSVTQNVKIWPNPTAYFNYSASPCSNGEVQFEDSSYSYQSTITNLSWEFEPYQYSSGQSPTHQFYYVDSCYNVKLIATNSRGCIDTTIQMVCVPAPLTLSFNHGLTCFGSPMLFSPHLETPSNDSLLTFSWNFGNPQSGSTNTSSMKEPSHLFTASGFYSVYLSSTDIYGCTALTSQTVEVKSIPVASFTYLPGICDNTVHFSSTSVDPSAQISSYIWNYGDGVTDTISAPVNTAIHQYAAPGIYDATLTVINMNSCATVITQTIQRNACLVSAFAQTDTLRCQNNAVTFSDQSTCDGSISQWLWTWGDNSQPTIYNSYKPTVTHVFAQPGIYRVTLKVSTMAGGASMSDVITTEIKVLASPIARFEADNICLGEKAVFRNTTNENGSNLVNYRWDFGDPETTLDSTSMLSPEYTYTSIGIYNASLIATNLDGCSDTLVSPLIVSGLPTAAFNYGLACPGHPTQFIDHSDSSLVPITRWEWFVNDTAQRGYITGKNASFTFDQQGAYLVQLKVTDANSCIDTVNQQVTINPGPVTAFSITENYDQEQGKLHLMNGTLGATEYHWDFGDGVTSSEESPITKYNGEGSYLISLRAENGFGCSDTISAIYELMYKGLYVPNAFSPTGSWDEVRYFKPAGINLASYSIKVFNSHGNVIWSSRLLDEKGAPAEQWDGTYKGKVCQQDVYVWQIQAIFRDNTIWENNDAGVRGNLESGQVFGTVTIIR
ncbi:MAG: PKD domain-containing protein [Bacteroidota bacterium]